MNIIVAACKNRGIGFKNTLPWTLKAEMKYFKNVTKDGGNSAVVMGKNTWLSLKKALPKRDNFVVSSTAVNHHWPIEASKFNKFTFIDDIRDIKRILPDYDDIWIIGGEKLYKSFINHKNIKAIYYTDIKNEFNCDTFFPEIPPNFSQIYNSNDIIENNIHYNIKIYKNNNFSHSDNILIKKYIKNNFISNQSMDYL